MEQETIKDEITANGNRKTMLGVRCFPELKFKLTEEAQALGITLSEHCENILLNKDVLLSEKEVAYHELELIKQKMLVVFETLAETKAQHKTELQKAKVEKDRLIAENDQLKKNAEIMKQQIALFSDKRLLFLFENLKGKKDTFDSPDGNTYNVTYNQPKDLLKALIYSFNIKKP